MRFNGQSICWMSSVCVAAMLLVARPFPAGAQVDLGKYHWRHGSNNCPENKDPGMEVVRYDPTTYILRQNKCLHYEAPFLYLFVGSERAVLVDTGAEAPVRLFPLAATVDSLLKKHQRKDGRPMQLLVIHSHDHDDHYAGDSQWSKNPLVTVVSPRKDSLIHFLQFRKWPEEEKVISLGNRYLTVIPIPGHDEASIAVYDMQTRWLLTGDTIYPGRLYVRNSTAFKDSIERLDRFCQTHSVLYLLGNHIEMSTALGKDYPVGTTYQPQEHSLPLSLTVLQELRDACRKQKGPLVYEVHNDFIIVPK